MADTADDRLLARVAAELRRPRAPRPGFDERVMAAVRAPHPPVPARAWAWLREPRALALSPLGGGGLALAAVVAGLAIGGVTMWRALRSAPGPALAGSAAAGAGAGGGTPARAIVTFVLVAPGARSVALAGDFDGWDRTRLMMRRGAPGLWTLDVLLAPGRYQYAFVVDGDRFVADPAAPPAVGDDFGQPTSVVTVGAPGGAAARAGGGAGSAGGTS